MSTATTTKPPAHGRRPVLLRGMDPQLWRRVGAEAKLQGLTLAQLLEAIITPALAEIDGARHGRWSREERAYQAGHAAGHEGK